MKCDNCEKKTVCKYQEKVEKINKELTEKVQDALKNQLKVSKDVNFPAFDINVTCKFFEKMYTSSRTITIGNPYETGTTSSPYYPAYPVYTTNITALTTNSDGDSTISTYNTSFNEDGTPICSINNEDLNKKSSIKETNNNNIWP